VDCALSLLAGGVAFLAQAVQVRSQLGSRHGGLGALVGIRPAFTCAQRRISLGSESPLGGPRLRSGHP